MTYSLEGCCPRSFQFNSIHAPARGATPTSAAPRSSLYRFNSRTHEGCDSYTPICSEVSMSFNSRTHEGCDILVR